MMAAASRPAGAGDAILGVAPRRAFLPAGVDECAEVMGLAAREKLRVAIIGGGTELGLGPPPPGPPAGGGSEGLGGLLHHCPPDIGLPLEAGARPARRRRPAGAAAR